MAAPIVLMSSSPPSYQAPIPPTPPRVHRSQDRSQPKGHSPPSPDLPSPSDLIGRGRRPTANHPHLKSGSRALPVPEGVITGFASAGRLLRENILDLGSEPEAPRRKPRSRKRNGKPANKGDTDANGGNQEAEDDTRVRMATAQESKRQRVEQRDDASLDMVADVTRFEPAENASKSTLGLSNLGEAAQGMKDAATPSSKHTTTSNENLNDCIAPGQEDGYELAIPGLHAADSTSTKPTNQRKRASHKTSAPQESLKKSERRRKGVKRCDQGTETVAIKKAKKTGTSSHHFSACEVAEANTTYAAVDNKACEPLDLDVALARRRDWTPTKNTVRRPQSPSGSMLDEASSKADDPVKLDLSTFAYPQGDVLKPGQTEKGSVGWTTAKKRRLDSTDVLVLDAEECGNAALQSKALKRPKTITERVIAPFRQDITKSNVVVPAATSSRSVSVPDHTNNDHQPLPASGSKTTFSLPQKPVRSHKPSKKSHKPVPPKARLLSPEAFERRLDRQDIIFATASQLINESPTYLKQYQQALRVSEVEAIAHGHRALMGPPGVALRGTTADTRHLKPVNLGDCLPAIPRPAGGLWSADTRVDDEVWAPTQKRSHLVMPAVMQRLRLSPVVDKSVDIGPVRKPSQSTPPDPALHTTQPAQHFAGDGDALPNECAGADTRGLDDSFVDIDDLIGHSFERSSSAPAILEPPPPPPPLQPEGDAARTEKLQSPLPAITSSGGATARLRDRIQRRSALEPLDGNALIGQQPSPAPKPTTRAMHTSPKPSHNVGLEQELAPVAKRPRGRPKRDTSEVKSSTLPAKKTRKPKAPGKPPPLNQSKSKVVNPSSTSSKSFIPIDEIEDSEPEISPSPRRRTKKSPVSALELVSSQGELLNEMQETPESRSAKAQFEKQEDEVYARITRIVKTTPRTSVPSEPSWHEKILLYDPIVLEDFTAWLNGQGATYMKYKAASDGPKGKTSKACKGRAEEDATVGAENTPLPLEAWMVQKWCEAHSVCCLWREGLRGGVKARY